MMPENPTQVLVDWSNIIHNAQGQGRDCTDNFRVKWWITRQPSNYSLSALLPPTDRQFTVKGLQRAKTYAFQVNKTFRIYSKGTTVGYITFLKKPYKIMDNHGNFVYQAMAYQRVDTVDRICFSSHYLLGNFPVMICSCRMYSMTNYVDSSEKRPAVVNQRNISSFSQM